MTNYTKAVRWLAANDDNEWLRETKPSPTVAADLVADVWRKGVETLRADLLAELRHIHPNSWHGKLPWEATQ